MANDNVVIVPGILGSEIQATVTFGIRKTVWLEYAYLAGFGPDTLQLDATGLAPGPIARWTCQASGAPVNNAYAPLSNALNSAGFNVSFWAYDWRLSFSVLAARLSAFLLNSFADKPFYLVCHSMGGLIARLAYAAYAAGAPATNWKRTLYAGTPHGGSYVSSQNLATAYPIGTWVGSLWEVLTQLNPSNLGSLFPGNRLSDRLSAVVSSWPSIYELSPSNTASWNGLDPNVAQCYTASNFTPFNSAFSAGRMTAALQTMQALEATITAPRAREICLVGLGLKTPVGIALPPNMDSDQGYDWAPDGDGVVPRERAILPGTFYWGTQTDHTGVVTNGQALSAIPALLRNGLSQNQNIPSPPLKPPLVIDPPLTFLPAPSVIPQFPKQTTGDP